MALTTVAKVKAYLGLSGSSDDALLTDLVAEAESAIVELTGGRQLEAASITEVLDGSGREALRLTHYPVNSVGTVKLAANRDFAAADPLAAGDLHFDPAAGLLYWRGGCWPLGLRNVQVTYNAGYSTLPVAITRAANIVVADWYTRAKQLASGQSQNELASENLGDRSESYHRELTDWGIPAPAKSLLMPYLKRV